jgi:hypothetical protein
MYFVVSKRRGIRKRFSNVRLVEIGKFLNDLRGRHSVCDQIHDVRDGDTKAANCRAPGENIWVPRNPLEGVRHCVSL